MDRAAIADFIERVYAARKAGDLDAVAAAFAPEAVFRLMGSPELVPAAVTARGATGVRAALKGLIDAFEFLEFEPIDLVVEGDRAVLHWRLKVRYIPSGVVRDTEVCDVLRFKDGKIASLTQFADTAMIIDMVAAKA
jgi:ketosteroid isomerase-like protein